MGAEGAGRGGVVEVEVEVEHTVGLYLQVLADSVHEQLSVLELAADDAQQGQHVLLPAELDAVVHLAVEVDGQVGDLHQGPADVDELRLRVHGVVRPQDDAPCHAERTVEPGGQDGSAIYLGIQPHDAALAGHLGIGLDAERGGVAVGADDVEPSLGERSAPDAEGVERGVVLLHVELAARRHLAKRF